MDRLRYELHDKQGGLTASLRYEPFLKRFYLVRRGQVRYVRPEHVEGIDVSGIDRA